MFHSLPSRIHTSLIVHSHINGCCSLFHPLLHSTVLVNDYDIQTANFPAFHLLFHEEPCLVPRRKSNLKFYVDYFFFFRLFRFCCCSQDFLTQGKTGKHFSPFIFTCTLFFVNERIFPLFRVDVCNEIVCGSRKKEEFVIIRAQFSLHCCCKCTENVDGGKLLHDIFIKEKQNSCSEGRKKLFIIFLSSHQNIVVSSLSIIVCNFPSYLIATRHPSHLVNEGDTFQ